jgi:dTDP-4-amino-4,6-dideoxygalactose transaminase
MINYGSHFINQDDINSIKKTLLSSYLTTGPGVKKFEQLLQKKINSKYVLSTSSGTSALYIAFKSLGIRKGDYVIIPTINFIASTNMLRNLDVKIILCDVDPFTGQMTKQNILNCIKRNRLKKIKALVVMYHGGSTIYAEDYIKLKKKFGFILIEDACHALGSEYKYKNSKYKVGCCKHAEASIFSFHPLKVITTGEGGAISFKKKNYIMNGEILRSHGIKRSKNHWDYDVVSSDFNFRLSDISASLGISQLKKMDRFIKKRKEVAKFYEQKLNNISDIIFLNKFSNLSSYHLYSVFINFKKLRFDKNKLIKYFLKKNIRLQSHYIPIYKFSYYRYLKKTFNFKGTEIFNKNVISFPIYFSLKKSDQMKVITFLKKRVLV